ncbi:MAG TPA: helix-turn-helix transcriptional regulator [Planctomycetota bacterium]|nr:helix-turn-helix transcriptional regulator [Planctomycetota bacterium]
MRPDYPAFSRLLIAALAKGERTHTWLAERLGFTQQHVSDIVNGKHRPPRRKIEAMAEVLGLEGQARQAFLDEAYLTHVPDFIRARLSRLEDQLRDARAAGDRQAKETADLTLEVNRQLALSQELQAAWQELARRHPELAAELKAIREGARNG